MGERYELLIAFEDESPSFVHGFEAGRIWEAMKTREMIVMTVHDENVALISQMAARNDYSAQFRASDIPGWVFLKAVPIT